MDSMMKRLTVVMEKICEEVKKVRVCATKTTNENIIIIIIIIMVKSSSIFNVDIRVHNLRITSAEARRSCWRC